MSVSLVPFILVGALLVVAYNLELFGGRFHSDFWFAAAWGAFPAFTAYWANSLSVGIAGVLVAAACFALSVAQRASARPCASCAAALSRSAGSSACETGASWSSRPQGSPRRSTPRCAQWRSAWCCSRSAC